jgi:hypothetical protein
MTEKQKTKLCVQKDFALVLEHSVQLIDEILSTAGEDPEVLEETTVTTSAAFILDALDYLVEYATRYEDFETSEIIGMLELQRNFQTRYGNRTMH